MKVERRHVAGVVAGVTGLALGGHRGAGAPFEPMGEQIGAGVGQAPGVGGEDPVSGDVPGTGSAFPSPEVPVDHGGGSGADGQAPVATGFGGPKHLEGQVPFYREHTAVEVAEAKDRKLCATCAGVGGEPDEEQGLFGHEQPLDQVPVGRFGSQHRRLDVTVDDVRFRSVMRL